MITPQIVQLHAAIQEFRMLGCWLLAEKLERVLRGSV